MALRVFHLTTEPPYPPISGGRVRSMAQLELLCGMGEVEELSVQHLFEDKNDEIARRGLEETFDKLRMLPPIEHPIHVRQHPTKIVPRILALRTLGVPYLAGKWSSSALTKRLKTAVPKARPNLLYVDHLGLMLYEKLLRKLAPGARLVLDQHNVESDFFVQGAKSRSGWKKTAFALEAQAARRYEIEALRRADAVVTISPTDAEIFQALLGDSAQASIHYVPQIVPLRERRRDVPRGSLLYVGNLGWHPNVAGLDWFFAEVWPKLREAKPELLLRVAGSGLPKRADGSLEIPPAWQQPGVEILGFVADLEPLYRSSSMVVAPILGGSGVRIKLLEAMRAGLPLVTTREAVVGTLATPGEHLEAEQDPSAFAVAVLALDADATRRVRLRDQAYTFLRSHHSESTAQAEMRKALGLTR